MRMRVRSIQEIDYDAWRDIWLDSVAAEGSSLSDRSIDACWRQITATADNDHGIHAMVACDSDDDVIGFLHYVLHPVAGAEHAVCYLQDLYVYPEFRRQGVGRALLEHLKDTATAHHWERIYWLVKDDNAKAAAFYEGQSIEVPFAVHMHPTRLVREHENDQNERNKRQVKAQ